MKRICIKAGSNVLTEADGRLDISRIAHLVKQLNTLHNEGVELYLISSGAVAAGRRFITADSKNDPVAQRQVCSAVGQVHLINLYQRLFMEYNKLCAQILVTKNDFKDRDHYLNMKDAFHAMQKNRVIPIVNENDTVAVSELMFTDNDELAGLIASMVNADALIILSNVDGLYTGDPNLPESELITDISAEEDDFSHVVQKSKSSFGRGGMHTKYRIATKTAESGTTVYIANGKRDNIIADIISGKNVPRTCFAASKTRKSGVKQWISSSESYAKATITVDAGAAKALLSENATSLLLIGIKKIEGTFKKGDIIKIVDQNKQIAIGQAGMDSTTAEKYIGERYSRPLVHYDYLSLT